MSLREQGLTQPTVAKVLSFTDTLVQKVVAEVKGRASEVMNAHSDANIMQHPEWDTAFELCDIFEQNNTTYIQDKYVRDSVKLRWLCSVGSSY